ncbi:MAG: hypothetical protein ABSH38_17590 [Verrucomicrobiota bacterium]
MPHIPQEPGLPLQEAGSEESPPVEAKTDSFFVNFFDPHFGQGVPAHRLERTRISLSAPHFPQ